MRAAADAVMLTTHVPIIFKQHRHGFNNETIEVYKFRSMYTHMSDPTARNAVTKNDPRVTPLGRFLRKSSIDDDEKIRFRTAFDLYYIENWSLLLDLKILILTPFRLLNTENAY